MKSPTRLLAPFVPWPHLRRIAGFAVAGALVAGCYGILHDQVTYTLSPEYFTRMKFGQFAWADVGFPRRVLVSEIGFLATWWVGFAATWFFARFAASRRGMAALPGAVAGMWFTLFGTALAAGALGWLLGPAYYLGASDWQEALTALGVENQRAFAQVGGIHLGGYLGALSGWLFSMFRLAATPVTPGSGRHPQDCER